MTLRSSPIPEVAGIASAAGLKGIEWATDAHVTNRDAAKLAASVSADCGLHVLSLGSYYRLGDFGGITELLATAAAAGAPRIRVWAGRDGSEGAPAEAWSSVVADAQRLGEAAAEHGLEIALEYHRRTLADTPGSTIELLDDIGHQNVNTYWQPPVGADDDEALASFEALAGRVSGVHCFSWWPGIERLPLAARRGLWDAIASSAARAGRPVDFMLEFVANDSPASAFADAKTLRQMVS